MARSQQWYDNLSPSKRRRVKARMVNRAALVGAGIPIAYYVLPMGSPGVSGTVLLAVGLLLIAVIVVWQVRVIINSPFHECRRSRPCWSESPCCSGFRYLLLRGRGEPGRQLHPADEQGRCHVFHRRRVLHRRVRRHHRQNRPRPQPDWGRSCSPPAWCCSSSPARQSESDGNATVQPARPTLTRQVVSNLVSGSPGE